MAAEYECTRLPACLSLSLSLSLTHLHRSLCAQFECTCLVSRVLYVRQPSLAPMVLLLRRRGRTQRICYMDGLFRPVEGVSPLLGQ